MSDGDRDGDSPLRLKRWLISAAMFAAVMVGYGGVQQGVYYYEAARHAAGYARNANDKIAAECRMPTAPANCERAIDGAAREDQRDEYDLYSQKAMALWTAIMGAMAVIGVSLSGVGIYLIWRTWAETRRAAEAGFQANEISRQGLEMANRPWLDIGIEFTDVPTVTEGHLCLPVRVTLTNCGGQFATVFRLASSGFNVLVEQRHDLTNEIKTMPLRPRGIIAPNQPLTMDTVVKIPLDKAFEGAGARKLRLPL